MTTPNRETTNKIIDEWYYSAPLKIPEELYQKTNELSSYLEANRMSACAKKLAHSILKQFQKKDEMRTHLFTKWLNGHENAYDIFHRLLRAVGNTANCPFVVFKEGQGSQKKCPGKKTKPKMDEEINLEIDEQIEPEIFAEMLEIVERSTRN